MTKFKQFTTVMHAIFVLMPLAFLYVMAMIIGDLNPFKKQ